MPTSSSERPTLSGPRQRKNLTASCPAVHEGQPSLLTQWKSVDIDELWNRLKWFEGHDFETKRGRPFRYEISGTVFRPTCTTYGISMADFGKALALVPFHGPSVINWLVRGPAYVWAVLHDRRIRGNDW